jgi:subtilisin family serine protease
LILRPTSLSLTIQTGIIALDDINKRYCCQEFKKFYICIKDTTLAEKLGMNRVYTLVLHCNSEDTSTIIDDYMKTGLFEYVEVNVHYKESTTPERFVPNDIQFRYQWSLDNKADDATLVSRVDADIDMPEAWAIEQGDTSIIIGLLDSGLKDWPNEFTGRIWKNVREVAGNNLDDDGNGYKDDVNGWNFVAANNYTNDDNGHGTMVASIAVSDVNDLYGMAGVNGKCKLMPVKISDSLGSSSLQNAANGLKYAVDNGARVLNISLAGYTNSQVIADMINYCYIKGAVICAGSGNNDSSIVCYPAKYAHVIAVGATGPSDKRAISWLLSDGTVGGSNYGDSLDVVAPGDSILCIMKNGMFKRRCGTSLSTPFVTGLASLLISQNPDITPDVVTQIIESTAEDQVGEPAEDTKGYDKYYGFGRINAYKALLKGEELKTGKKPKALVNKEISKWISWSRHTRQLNVCLGKEVNSSSPMTIRVVDASGKVLRSVTISDHAESHEISLPSVSSGVYFYTIKYDNGAWSGKILD